MTRDAEGIRTFVEARGGKAIIKPLQGSGGQNVFMVNRRDAPNLNQMIEAITRDGYVVAQEYLPATAKGDVRAVPHERAAAGVKSGSAGGLRPRADRRGPAEQHPRRRQGGGCRGHRFDAAYRRHRPAKLVCDGIFLVGLDVAGDKLMEINLFSPGGLGTVKQQHRIDFAPLVIEALEKKVEQRIYGGFANSELASM